jgi:hypothetical protein
MLVQSIFFGFKYVGKAWSCGTEFLWVAISRSGTV